MSTPNESQSERSVGTQYDGFISYSHSADDLLAPRLQSGLQKFAKPWWKRRAVRIFRDESSLSANPHLWSSITEALDTSGWFVLLLSPDAAQSEWVNQEIAYWVEHRDPKKILPVVTDGSFGWVDGEVTGDSVPDALRGVFSEEPRWVDVRWAKDEDQLDLQDPRFADAVADVASTIRGIPKDDLASEEVRQHRRTVRTAWAAGIALLALTVVAVGASIQSGRNANEAERQAEIAAEQADLAEANAEEAQVNAAEADAQRREAEASRQEALAAAKLARARELAATALEKLDEDPQLSTLLALESIRVAGNDPPGFLVDTMWEAAQANHLDSVLQMSAGSDVSIGLSPDGARLAAADSEGMVAVFEVPSGKLVWSRQLETADVPAFPAFHPDGSTIAVSMIDSNSRSWGLDRTDDLPNRAIFLDAKDGSQLSAIAFPDCLSSGAWGGWSPDGSVFAVSSGWEPCERDGTSGMWLEILDGSDFESIAVFDTPSLDETGPIDLEFTNDGDLYAFFWPGTDVLVVEGPDYAVSRPVKGIDGPGGVSPDGRSIATYSNGRPAQMAIFDAESRAQTNVFEIGTFASLVSPVAFTPDASLIAIGTEGRDTFVYNVQSGTRLLSLPSSSADTPVFSPDGRWLYTAHRGNGTVKVWDLAPQTLGQTVVSELRPGDHVNKAFSVGPDLGAAMVINGSSGTFETRVVLFDVRDGSIVSEISDAFGRVALADGRVVVKRDGRVIVHDPSTGAEVEIAGCASADFEMCDDSGEPVPDVGPYASLDGTELMIYDHGPDGWSIVSPDDGLVIEAGGFPVQTGFGLAFTEDWIMSSLAYDLTAVLDRSTGDEIARVEFALDAWDHSNDHSLLASAGVGGDVDIVDIDTWSSWTISADFDRARGIGFSPSDRLLA
ncbi:MAG: TIR domain-containing protein, partial [Acidimicrobiia bacterium]|nr:TIR domain-containing protein [Acidimicrobiia bacterium]